MKIEISSLEIMAKHGVLAEEKTTPQPFVFDVSVEADCEDAALRDDLSLTVNYSEVCALVTEIATAKSYDLIEALARECALSLLEKFTLATAVTVRVSKPAAPVKANVGNVSVTYSAERNKVYLSLGSSQGDRERTIKSAINKLNALRGVDVLRVSSMVKTAPEGGVAKNEFVNCAAELDLGRQNHRYRYNLLRRQGHCRRRPRRSPSLLQSAQIRHRALKAALPRKNLPPLAQSGKGYVIIVL